MASRTVEFQYLTGLKRSMGQKTSARNSYKHDNILQSREDILAERAGHGKLLFRFYQDLLTLRRRMEGGQNVGNFGATIGTDSGERVYRLVKQ